MSASGRICCYAINAVNQCQIYTLLQVQLLPLYLKITFVIYFGFFFVEAYTYSQVFRLFLYRESILQEALC